jgi:BTB/POZ domain-containing protein 9
MRRFFEQRKFSLFERSDYFRALLFGGLKESNLSEIELKDTPLQAFKMLLRYIYTGQVSFSS